ncbi:MAG: HD domain-containing protein [Chloroflexota bacterium]
MSDLLIKQTAAHVQAAMSDEGSGHDWWHVWRVWNMAQRIAKNEAARGADVDTQVVELAALLHDLGDHKFHGGDVSVAPRMTRDWLHSLGADAETIEAVAEIVGTLSFKGANVETPMRTLEGRIVQDADRLDAIGAIGIARTFAYGGHKGRELYNPDVPPLQHDDFAAYSGSASPSINHFYEKLLLLKERMNTDDAKRFAEERHRFMEQFLEQFFEEWNGDDGINDARR